MHGAEGAQVAAPNGVGHSGDEDKEEEEEGADYDPRADPRLGPFSSAANASAPDSKAAGAAVATAGATAASAGSGRKQQQQQAEVDVADLLSSKMLQVGLESGVRCWSGCQDQPHSALGCAGSCCRRCGACEHERLKRVRMETQVCAAWWSGWGWLRT